jgi:hypothetical protein
MKDFYAKAKKKADSFLPGIDKDLKANVEMEKGPTGERMVLAFTHKKNPNIHWNQVLFTEGGDSWIENDFEKGVKRTYDELAAK